MRSRVVTRDGLIRHLRRQKAEIEQYFRDVGYWNDHHPDPTDQIREGEAAMRRLLRWVEGSLAKLKEGR